MKKNLVFPCICLFFLLWVVTAGAVPATIEAQAKLSEAEIRASEVLNKIESLKQRQGLDDAQKAKIMSVYQEALDNLESKEQFNRQTEEYKSAIRTAPQTAKQLRATVETYQKKTGQIKSEDWGSIPTEELEQRLVMEKSKASGFDDQIQSKENELSLQSSRPQAIREELAAATQALESARSQLSTLSTIPEGSAFENEAQQMMLKTRISRRDAELKKLDAESLSNAVRVDLLKAELQWLEIQRSELDPATDAIEAHLADRRQKEARKLQDEFSLAEKELSGKHPLIQRVTRENLQFTLDLQSVIEKTEQYAEQKNAIDQVSTNIANDFKSAEKKIGLAGLSPALGKILREQRRSLNGQVRKRPLAKNLQDVTATASLQQFKIDDQLQSLSNVGEELKSLMQSEVNQSWPLSQRMMIQAELRILLNTKKDLLSKLSMAYAAYLRALGDYDFSLQQLQTQAGKFAQFLDERLLWVPSSEPLNLAIFSGLISSFQWLLSPGNWLRAGQDLFAAASERPFLAFIVVVLGGLIPPVKRRLKARLKAVLESADKTYSDSFFNAIQALICAMLLSLPIPAALYLLGWFLGGYWQAADFSSSVANGLKTAAVPLLVIQIFYRVFAPSGIAAKHFQWHKANAALLRRNFGWVRFVAVPGIFLIYSTGASKNELYGDSLGRMALIAVMAGMTVFFAKILKPGEGLLKAHIDMHPSGWVARLRYIWYPAVLLPPLVVVGFAVAGYYLSALELQQKLVVSLRICFALTLVHELVLRWLTIANRQLAIRNARQMRKAAQQSEKSVSAGVDEPLLPADDCLVDIPKINAQTVKLLNVSIAFGALTGVGFVWQNILPAFSFLDRIVLWKHLVRVDDQEIWMPVTMINLILAGFYVFMTVVAVRNFSGVMELLVFRRWSVETGGRYAVNQLATYALVAIGFISVANELGGSWSDVQWLVAALSVGLGFGLQEIFANFVSGIILLFERPVRIGDTCTIGDVTGKVSRIQMRATTLIDWDQKELIVPNKTFITSHLVNWSLSDAVTRVVIPVGVAYGSDVSEAHRIIVETVKSTPLVLAEPEPSVVLLGFGESSLDFSVRIFVSELSHRLLATHNIHVRLEKALREHGIEIPFPQRDVHIRSTGVAAAPVSQAK